MEALQKYKMVSLRDVVITENPELGRILGNRILFPEKNEMAKEHIRKYGLPKDMRVSKPS